MSLFSRPWIISEITVLAYVFMSHTFFLFERNQFSAWLCPLYKSADGNIRVKHCVTIIFINGLVSNFPKINASADLKNGVVFPS